MTSQVSRATKARTRRRLCLRRCLTVSCGVLALLCLALGVAITFAFDYVFREQLKVLMPLANGSMSYRGWSEPPNEISFQIWLWNVTNPKAIVRGERPILEQVGPFTFAEKRSKSDIEFYDNDTVSFREYQRFFYLPERSVGNISELMITSTNMPYAVTSQRTKYMSKHMRAIVSNFFKGYSGGLFVTRTAKEILLGYTDRALKSVEGSIRFFAPGMKFQSTTGLFIGRNNSNNGLFLVHTGRGNLSNFNRVQRWNGQPALDVWPDAEANQIVGTDGSMFSPGVRPGASLDIFSIDICSSIQLVYSHRTEVEGLPALSFVPSPEIMLNATLRPENRAYCTPELCLDSGVRNISLCKDGVPLVISSPHFTGAPTYQSSIEGMQPSDADYGTRISIEPNTGFVINAQRRMQMNIILERVKGFADTERLIEPMLLMPLMWLNESGRIDPTSAAQFKAHLLAPIEIVGYAQWVLIVVGCVWMAATALVCSLLARRRRQRRLRQGGWRGQPSQPPAPSAAAAAGSGVALNGGGSSSNHYDDVELRMDNELIRKLQDDSIPESHIF